MLNWLLLYMLLAGVPAVGAPNRFRVYSNTQISVLSITGDNRGILWLGATDGLYRFDGQRYQRVAGFPIQKVKHVAVDGEGTLWAGGAEGLVRYRERPEVVLREPVTSLTGEPFVLVATARDTWRALPSGKLRRVHGGTTKGYLIRENQAWFICERRVCRLDFSKWEEGNGQVALHRDMEVGPEAEQAVLNNDGWLWVGDETGASAYRGGKFVQRLPRRSYPGTERQLPLLVGPSGGVWFLSETIGIDERDFLRNEQYGRFAATAGWEDGRGRLWVAYRGEGIVEWVPDTRTMRWFREQNFGLEQPILVTRGSTGRVVTLTNDSLFELQGKDFKRIGTGPRRYHYLFPLPGGEWLAAVAPGELLRLNADGGVLERVRNPPGAESIFGTMAADSDGQVWVTNRQYLGWLAGKPGQLFVQRADVSWPRVTVQTVEVDLHRDQQQRMWVGHPGGLAVRDGDKWEPVVTERPLRSVRTFAVGKDEVWVSYRVRGVFSRLRRDGSLFRVTDFSENDGYLPHETRFLRRDSRGWIWRGTPEGVRVSNGRNTAPDDWLQLDGSNGIGVTDLNRHGFFDMDGTVWLAGVEGVVQLDPRPEWFEAPKEAPALSGFTVTDDGAHAEVSTLFASPFRPKPLRYRLLPVMNEWRLSADGALSFAKLPVGEYTLEVAHAGAGEPAVLRRTFTITGAASGVWRWWLLLPGVLAGVGGLVLSRSEWARYWVAKWRYRLRWRMGMERASYEMAPGEVLGGHYRVVRLLSEGGFSLVYEAEDTRQKGQRLALKVALPVPGEPEWVRERFAFEVATLRSIRHPGVVPVLDSWMDERGWPCLVMPLLEGPTLREALARGPVAVARAARLIRQMGAALGEIHGRGVVHRDVKPDNVILTDGRDGEQAVLIDFGAAAFQAGNSGFATTRLVAASVRYTAPERLTGHYSPASDVYSLAVTILEMVSGRQAAELGAVAGTAAFAEAIEAALRVALGGQASARVAALLAGGFALDAGQRPGDVGAWCEAIAGALEE